MEMTAAHGRAGLRAYLELCKAGLTLLVVATAAAGFALGRGGGAAACGWGRLAWVLAGTFLTASGAVAINQAWDWKRDARMRRTEQRPIPTGRIPIARALRVGAACIVIGLGILTARTNALTAILGFADAAIYLLLYTPLKPRTSLCTLVGAVCGALPPMMGWAAATGRLDPGAWILGAMLFIWQIPHFLALAWLYRADYERGGFRVLPVVDRTGALTARLSVLYSLASIPLAAASARAGMGGWVFLIGAVGLAVGIFVFGVRLMRRRTEARARALFVASLVYLPVLLALLLADRGRLVIGP